MKKPKIPDPKLPPQPINQEDPANLEIGRKNTAANAIPRSRRKLRIRLDKAGTQSSGGAAGTGVSTPSAGK